MSSGPGGWQRNLDAEGARQLIEARITAHSDRRRCRAGHTGSGPGAPAWPPHIREVVVTHVRGLRRSDTHLPARVQEDLRIGLPRTDLALPANRESTPPARSWPARPAAVVAVGDHAQLEARAAEGREQGGQLMRTTLSGWYALSMNALIRGPFPLPACWSAQRHKLTVRNSAPRIRVRSPKPHKVVPQFEGARPVVVLQRRARSSRLRTRSPSATRLPATDVEAAGSLWRMVPSR